MHDFTVYSIFLARDRRQWLVWLVLAVNAAVGVWWLWSVGTVDDDLAYCHVIADRSDPQLTAYMTDPGRPIATLGDALESAVNHWRHINARLSDKVLILTPLLPVKVVNVLCGLLIGLQLWLMVVMSGLRRRPLSVAWLCVLSWWLLPWSDLFAERAFVLNYVGGGVMLMTAILLCDSRRPLWLAIIAVIVGTAWHELFAVALGALLVTKAVMGAKQHHDLNRRNLTVVIAWAVTMAITLSNGALMRRGAVETAFSVNGLQLMLSRLAGQGWPLGLGLVCVIIAYKKRRRATSLQGTRVVGLTVAMVVSAGVAVALLQTGRYMWAPLLLAMVLIGSACALLPPLKTKHEAVVTTVFCIGLALWGWQLGRWQARYSLTLHELGQEVLSHPGQVVEAELPEADDTPWYIAGIVDWKPGFLPTVLMVWQGVNHLDGLPVVAPKGYGCQPLERWPRLPGNNYLYGQSGLWYEPGAQARIIYEVTFGDYTPASSPVDRLWCELRRRLTGRQVFPCQGWTVDAGMVGNTRVALFELGNFQRGEVTRQIVSVDSVGQMPTGIHP